MKITKNNCNPPVAVKFMMFDVDIVGIAKVKTKYDV